MMQYDRAVDRSAGRSFPLLPALAIYAFGIAISYAFRSDDSPAFWLSCVAISGAGTLFYVWRTMDWEGHQFDAFVAVYLLASIVNRLLYILDFAVGVSRTADWPVPTLDPEIAMLKGEIVTVVGILLTSWAWHSLSTRLRSPDRFANIAGHYTDNPRGYFLLWSVGVAAEVASRLYGEQTAVLGAAVGVARAAGLMSVLALTYVLWSKPAFRLISVWLLSLPFVYASLGSGFKENVIYACLPIAIVAWRELRSKRARIVLLVFGMLFVGVVTSYVQYYRERVWTRNESLSIGEISREFADQERYSSDASEGIPLFLARNNAMYHHGWAIDVKDRGEVSASEIFAPLVYIFIPRFLWPEKPEVNPGAEHSERIWGSHYVLVTNSATAAGLYPSLYMAGGYLAVIIGAIAAGALMAYTFYLLSRYATRFATGIYAWALFLTALRLDDNWPVFVFSAPLINSAYAAVFGLAAVIFSGGSVAKFNTKPSLH